jgi:hypothetical protein
MDFVSCEVWLVFSKITANVQVFMKKGEFGTRQPVTDAGFCSKVELLPTAS